MGRKTEHIHALRFFGAVAQFREDADVPCLGGGVAGDCGVDGIGGGADDSGDEYVKPLGFGNGVDSGMDDVGNCGG